MVITLALVLILICIALLVLAAFPRLVTSPSWLHFGWAGVLVLAILLLVVSP